MDAPPPVSADDLAATPPSVLALIHWLTARVSTLEAEVAELKARLNKDSTNSSLPPSASTRTPSRLPPSPSPSAVAAANPATTSTSGALIPVERVPGRHPLRPDRLPPVRPGAPRHRSRTAAASGLGAARDPADRHRIPTAPARLLLRLLHLRRVARGRADRSGRAAADRLQRVAHGLLPPVEAAGRPVPRHDPQPARQRRLDGRCCRTAPPRRCSRPTTNSPRQLPDASRS